MKRLRVTLQHEEKDCSAGCLSTIACYYGRNLSLTHCRELIKIDNDGASIYALGQAASNIGFDATPLKGSYDELMDSIKNNEVCCPFVARVINENMYEHFIVVFSIKKDTVVIGDPGKGKLKIPVNCFKDIWTGHIVNLKPNERFLKKNDKRHSMKKYIDLISSQRKLIGIVIVVSLIMNCISVIGSSVFEYIVNSVTQTASGSTSVTSILNILFNNLDSLCLAVFALYLFQSAVTLARNYILAKVSCGIDKTLNNGLFEHLISLPVYFFKTRKKGNILTRFGDTNTFRECISSFIFTFIVDLSMAVLFGIYLSTISIPLFMISFAIMVAYTIIVLIFKSPIHKVNMSALETEALITSHLEESLSGIESIKANNLHVKVISKFKELYERMLDINIKGSVTFSIQDVLIDFIASTGTLAVLWLGNHLCLNSSLTVGSLLSFYIMSGYFFEPVKNLLELQPAIQKAFAAADRINDIFDISPENNFPNNTTVSLKGDIVFDNIVFRYGYREPTINRLSCTVKNGTKVAIVGESGSGKSTLMNLLMGIYRPESGRILVGTRNLLDYSADSIRSHIATVQQETFFFSDTIRNNLSLWDYNITDDDILAALKKANALDFVYNMPMGLDTILSENASNLSGGQRQRLAIARALLKNPDVLILDEATSCLDSISEQGIKEEVYSATNGITTFIIAHRLSTIRNCDCIFVMDHGTIVESGTHDELINAKGSYYKYWMANCI